MPEHPESFPVNALVPIPGTPMENNEPVSVHNLIRTIATARIVLPTTIIRLAAGRQTLSESKQAMCFLSGANAVFTGEKMLTTPCTSCLLLLFVTILTWTRDSFYVCRFAGSPWDEVSYTTSPSLSVSLVSDILYLRRTKP